MQNARKIFDQEIEALKQEVGDNAVYKALLAFSTILKWLRTGGHGNLQLSAFKHVVGPKIRIDMVVPIEDK